MKLESLKHYCITLSEDGERFKTTQAHLADHGINVIPFRGIENNVAGIETTNLYEVDNPGSGFKIGGKCIGIALSHWMIWRFAEIQDDDAIVVYEDDVRVCLGGIERARFCLENIPNDWGILYLGSCCCSGKRHQSDQYLWKVWYPVCLHAYVLRKSAARKLIACHRKLWAPVDISMIFDCYTQVGVNVYTTIPRAFDQYNTYIPE